MKNEGCFEVDIINTLFGLVKPQLHRISSSLSAPMIGLVALRDHFSNWLVRQLCQEDIPLNFQKNEMAEWNRNILFRQNIF